MLSDSRLLMKYSDLLISTLLLGTFVTNAGSEQLSELMYEELPSSGLLVDDPSAAVIVVESTVTGLQFNSRAGIQKVIDSGNGLYKIFLPPGVHIVKVAAEGYLPLKLPRLNLTPKSARKYRIRAKTNEDQDSSVPPELRLIMPQGIEADMYIQVDDDPLQKVKEVGEVQVLRPAPGQHRIRAIYEGRAWQKTVLLQSGMSYTERVVFGDKEKDLLSKPIVTGGVYVVTDPVGATVSLNGIQQSGVTPMTITGLAPGTYRVELVLAQHEMLLKEVQVTELEISRFNEELAPTFGQLEIDSDPTGAILLLNDEQVGETPYRVRMDPGRYAIRLMVPMYHDTSATIDVEVGSTLSRRYVLRARFATLAVETNPPGAKLTVDGQPWGTTPFREDKLKSGAYAFKISLPGYETQMDLVPVPEGETVHKRYNLRAQVGHLQIETEPAGATVYVDGNKVEGTTPLILRDVVVGTREIRLTLPGFNEHTERVELGKDQLLGVQVELGSKSGEGKAAEVENTTIGNRVVGWRVLIGQFLSQDEAERLKGRAKKRLRRQDIDVYFRAPWYKVEVGHYRTDPQAQAATEKIELYYPNALKVRSYIELSQTVESAAFDETMLDKATLADDVGMHQGHGADASSRIDSSTQYRAFLQHRLQSDAIELAYFELRKYWSSKDLVGLDFIFEGTLAESDKILPQDSFRDNSFLHSFAGLRISGRLLKSDHYRLSLGSRWQVAETGSNLTPGDKDRLGDYVYSRLQARSFTVHEVGLTRDSRDRKDFPNQGTLASYTLGFIGQNSVGSVAFRKHLVEFDHYFGERFLRGVWRIKATAGFVYDNLDKVDGKVPIGVRFQPGGAGNKDGNVRGYPLYSIGPRYGGTNIGGRSMIVANVEYRYSKAEDLYYFIFADFGNSWNYLSEANPIFMHRSVGFCVKTKGRMIVELGMGYGLDTDKLYKSSSNTVMYFRFGIQSL